MEDFNVVTATVRLFIKAGQSRDPIDLAVHALYGFTDENITMVSIDQGTITSEFNAMSETERRALSRWLEGRRLRARTLGQS